MFLGVSLNLAKETEEGEDKNKQTKHTSHDNMWTKLNGEDSSARASMGGRESMGGIPTQRRTGN